MFTIKLTEKKNFKEKNSLWYTEKIIYIIFFVSKYFSYIAL